MLLIYIFPITYENVGPLTLWGAWMSLVDTDFTKEMSENKVVLFALRDGARMMIKIVLKPEKLILLIFPKHSKE